MLARLLCLLLFIAPCSFAQSAPTEQATTNQLKMVVILTRHGVRSPLSVPAAQASWPQNQLDWGVDCCGDLTPSGEQLVRLMGAYYHDYYADPKRSLLSKDCPGKQVFIWADNEERTMETGRELAEGLAGHSHGCNIPVHSETYIPFACNPSANDKSCQRTCLLGSKCVIDRLFHASYSDVEGKKIQDIADDINRRYPDLVKQYRKSLDDLKATLCPSGTCMAGLDHAQVKDGKLNWEGRFSAGSTASEIFLLEYAHGMPCSKVGWGKVAFSAPDCLQGQSFRQMQELHTAYFQETQRAPYIAWIQGEQLLNAISKRLFSATQPNPPPEKLVIYAGHDTNIANIAGIFDFKWKPCDLPENDTPPAGALVFELYQDGPNDYSIHVRYVYQRLKQLRTKAELTLDNPPQWLEVARLNCKDRSCDIRKLDKSAFQPVAEQAACPDK